MHGTPVDIKSLSEFLLKSVSQSRVHIIEDASQAHGATNPDGTKLGEYSDAVVYSLYPTKNLGALGDAGVVTTKDYQLGQKIRVLRNYGSREGDKYTHEIVGFNNRLDPIQASILLVNLRMLSKWNAIRRELCNQYISKLSGDIEILQSPRVDSVRHHFCILSEKRDSLREFLRNCGVMTEIHYPKAAGVEVSKLTGQNVNFPNSERIAKSTLSLPLSQWHSLAQINYVVDKVLAWSNL
jgi:dTDP-4-amino-4,6-dideoxygalactose transaminase